MNSSEERAHEAVRIIYTPHPIADYWHRCLCPLKGHIIKNAYCRKAPLVPDNLVNLGLIWGNDTTAGGWNSPARRHWSLGGWKHTASWRRRGEGTVDGFGVLLGPAWGEATLPAADSTVFHLIPWTSVKSFSLPTSAQEPINFSKSEHLSKDSGGRHYSSGLRATDMFVTMKKMFASQGPVFQGC